MGYTGWFSFDASVFTWHIGFHHHVYFQVIGIDLSPPEAQLINHAQPLSNEISRENAIERHKTTHLEVFDDLQRGFAGRLLPEGAFFISG